MSNQSDQIYEYIHYLRGKLGEVSGMPSERYANEALKQAYSLLEKRMGLAPPNKFVVQHSWSVPRGKAITFTEKRTLTLHPLDLVEFWSGFATSTDHSLQALDMLRKFIHEAIDMGYRLD